MTAWPPIPAPMPLNERYLRATRWALAAIAGWTADIDLSDGVPSYIGLTLLTFANLADLAHASEGGYTGVPARDVASIVAITGADEILVEEATSWLAARNLLRPDPARPGVFHLADEAWEAMPS